MCILIEEQSPTLPSGWSWPVFSSVGSYTHLRCNHLLYPIRICTSFPEKVWRKHQLVRIKAEVWSPRPRCSHALPDTSWPQKLDILGQNIMPCVCSDAVLCEVRMPPHWTNIHWHIACQVGYTQQWLWLEQKRFVPKIEVALSRPPQLIYFQEESMSYCVLLLWDPVVVVPSHCNLPVCTATLWLGRLSQFYTPQTIDTALCGTSVRVFPRGGTKSEKEIDVLYDFIYLVTGHSDVSTPGGECYGSSSSDSRWVWISLTGL